MTNRTLFFRTCGKMSAVSSRDKYVTRQRAQKREEEGGRHAWRKIYPRRKNTLYSLRVLQPCLESISPCQYTVWEGYAFLWVDIKLYAGERGDETVLCVEIREGIF